jgi:hypothetical protein
MKIIFSIEDSSLNFLTATLKEVAVSEDFKKIISNIFLKCAEIYKAKIIENIENNKFGFNLTESTIRKKVLKGLNLKDAETPLRFRSDYIKSIIVRQISENSFEVTCVDGMHYSGMSFKELAYLLEFGRKDLNIPARPVWRLTYKKLFATFKEVANLEISKENMFKLTSNMISKKFKF